VQIDEIELPTTTSSENSTNDIKKNIQYLPYILKIFQRINIESLKVKNNEFTITIDESIFYIDNKFINISAQPVVEEHSITLKLYSLYLKDYKLLFDGLLKTDFNTHDTLYSGNIFYKELELSLDAQTQEKSIDFTLRGEKEFQSLKFVKDFVQLHPTIEEWMYDNIKGDIHLDFLQGQLEKDSFMPILSSLDGLAYVKNADILFHKDVNTIKTPLITVSFKNDNLYFDLEKPMYKNISIDGSNVVIHSLSGDAEPSNIVIELKTKHHLDKDILNILKAYEVHLPIIQLDGSTQSTLAIQVFFKDNSLHTKGVFHAKNSNFSLDGFEFLAHNATVELNDEMVLIKESNVEVKEMFKAYLNLAINTNTKSAKGDALVKKFKIQTKELPLIHIDSIATDILLDYQEFTRITLPELFTEISVLKEGTQIHIDNLAFAHSYSEILKNLKIKKGTLDIVLHSKDNIDFNATLDELDFPIFEQSGEQLTHTSIVGNMSNDIISINSLDERIKVRIEDGKNFITLDGLNISNIAIKSTQNEQNDEKKEEKNTLHIQINGINSNIALNDKQKLLANNYVLIIEENKINLNLQHKEGNLYYLKDGTDKIEFYGNNLSSAFINQLVGIENFFQDGEFNLKVKGTASLLQGEVTTANAKIKQLAILNNLITFINTTPAIINPLLAIPSFVGMATNKGFNLTGYRIVEGSLNFRYDLERELFYIDNLNTVGNMADFKAVGLIDLEKKEINSDVVVIFLKDYSKILGYVPVLNYLFLGDDKNVSTRVQIYGSLDDPKIETNLTQDAADASLNFVKRIFNLPAKGLELLTPSN